MLLECPECGGKVSDKASACPHCGYPINAQIEPKKRKKSTRRKLPNGFGSVQKLSGNRKNPFAAYPPCGKLKDNGVAERKTAIGYYKTYNEAYTALMEYNKNPFDVDRRKITFSEVYEMWFNEKFNDKAKVMSIQSKQSTIAAYKNVSALHNKEIMSITADDMQYIIDNSPLGYSSKSNMIVLFKGVFEFADKKDLVIKDQSQFLSVKIENDAEHGEPFSDEQLQILWDNRDDKAVQSILVMIYTGHRISEYRVADIDLDNMLITGGLKNKRSKERTVPICEHIKDYVNGMVVLNVTPNCFRTKYFYPTLERLGIDTIHSKRHTPHDCRHTFSWLCDRYGVDDVAKNIMLGHSLGKTIDKKVYTHRTIDELKAEISKIENPYLS